MVGWEATMDKQHIVSKPDGGHYTVRRFCFARKKSLIKNRLRIVFNATRLKFI